MIDTVSDLVAQKPLVTVSPSCPVDKACRLMAREDAAAIAVCDGDRLIGLLTERNLMLNWDLIAQEGDALRVAQIMTPNPAVIEASSALWEAVQKMDAERTCHLPVLQKGKPVAVLSRQDIPAEHRHATAPQVSIAAE